MFNTQVVFDSTLIIDLVIIVAAAGVGGFIAAKLKQPVILGYLIAGIIVGPNTPGFTADAGNLQFFSELGVAFLLFVMGAENGPEKFRSVGKAIIIAGLGKLPFTIALGTGMGMLLGFDFKESIFFGSIIAIASSAVIAKVLEDRNETASMHGRLAFGVSIVEDLASIPLLVFLLAVLTPSGSFADVMIALGKAIGILVLTYYLGKWLWPKILAVVAAVDSRELLLLVTISLALGGGLAVQELGLSFAIGAFLAGIVVAESKFQSRAINAILPLRDAFAALFFVSIGLLVDPSVYLDHPFAVIGMVLTIIVGKALITAVLIRSMDFPWEVALVAGVALAQIGEFSFIMARVGIDNGIIDTYMFNLVIAGALVTIMLNSLLLDSAPPVMSRLAQITHVRSLVAKNAARKAAAAERRVRSGSMK